MKCLRLFYKLYKREVSKKNLLYKRTSYGHSFETSTSCNFSTVLPSETEKLGR